MTPEGILGLSGALHFLQIPSLYVLSRGTLHLERELPRLSPINARLVTLFVAALTVLLLGLGGLIVLFKHQLVITAFGQSLCWLFAAFWCLRVLAQLWLHPVWPMKGSGKRLYYGLLALYAYLAASYLFVALATRA